MLKKEKSVGFIFQVDNQAVQNFRLRTSAASFGVSAHLMQINDPMLPNSHVFCLMKHDRSGTGKWI